VLTWILRKWDIKKYRWIHLAQDRIVFVSMAVYFELLKHFFLLSKMLTENKYGLFKAISLYENLVLQICINGSCNVESSTLGSYLGCSQFEP